MNTLIKMQPENSKNPGEHVSYLPYAFADGSLDIAYEEIAEARANCLTANLDGKISDEVWEKAVNYFRNDYRKIGFIPLEELNDMIARYASQNKSRIYQFDDFTVTCL